MNHYRYAKEHILAVGKPVALIDVDGVMQDNAHRLAHICHEVNGVQKKLKNADWGTFESLADQDAAGVFAPLVAGLAHAFTPVYLTARVDRENGNKERLAAELRRITGLHYAPLLMRSLESLASRESAVDFKRGVLRTLTADGIAIAMAVDDSHDNCRMFMDFGIPSLRLYNHLAPTAYSH